MLKIIQDAQRRPDLFAWFGAIATAELEAWLSRQGVAWPIDLLEFWSATGGGDAFESETFFRPNVASVPNANCLDCDYVEARNDALHTAGLPHDLLVFADGAFLSAVRATDGQFVTLRENHSIEMAFGSFDHWYSATMRAEFADRYGL